MVTDTQIMVFCFFVRVVQCSLV